MLTERQYQVYQYIYNFFLRKGHSPTLAEIGEAFSITSRGVIHRYLEVLTKAGLISRTARASRSIRLVGKPKPLGMSLPLVGTIAAGYPIEAIEDRQTFDLGDIVMGNDRFVLQVRGDSMIGDNICDGDYVICERSERARANEIAVVLVDGYEATLKRVLNNDDESVTLLPSNPALKPMVYAPERIQVQGVYLGLVRMA